MSKKNKVRCPDCGALYDPNEVEHVIRDYETTDQCLIVPVEQPHQWHD